MWFIHQGTRIPTLLCHLPSATRAVWNCPCCFCRHSPWESVTGLRFTLSLWVRDCSTWGHQFQPMVVMIQHLCQGKGKDNLKDPGATLRLPANLKVLIFPASAIEADKIKEIQTYGKAFSEFIDTREFIPLLLVSLILCWTPVFSISHYLNNQPALLRPSRKWCYPAGNS